MRIWLGATLGVASALLIAAAAYSQDAKTAFDPVPVEQRQELANRLIAYTKAFRGKHWDSLYDLAADVNKRRSDGSLMSRKTFGLLMTRGDDWYRLLKFMAMRTEMTSAGQFDVYGSGEFRAAKNSPNALPSQFVRFANMTLGHSRLGIISILANPLASFRSWLEAFVSSASGVLA